jgi:hypothetical protein
MSVGQVALAAGQALLIAFGSLLSDHAVHVMLRMNTEHLQAHAISIWFALQRYVVAMLLFTTRGVLSRSH